MHILFLTDNFPPEVNAPASRTFEHAREWVAAGARVTVITGAPNFPTGKVFDGYRNRLWQREQIDGIEVIRVWTYITANAGFARRTLDYLSFMFSAAIAALWVRGIDAVVGTSPQFFTACAAWFVGALRRRPFVFELRDLWPESIKAVGAMRQSRFITALEKVEWFLYRRAAHIVSVTESFKRHLVERGITGEKISVITNGVDLQRFAPGAKDPDLVAEFQLDGCFVAGYIGTHGMAHRLDSLLELAHRQPKMADGRPFRLLLVGDGAEKSALQQRAAAMALNNVIFVDTVSKDQIVRYWSLLDVSIVHLRKTPVFETVIPSKIFEAMAMGIPLLHGVAGESAAIVEREGCGICVPPENVLAMREALQRFAGESGLAQRCAAAGLAAAQRYARPTLARRMLEVLEGLVAKKAG